MNTNKGSKLFKYPLENKRNWDDTVKLSKFYHIVGSFGLKL